MRCKQFAFGGKGVFAGIVLLGIVAFSVQLASLGPARAREAGTGRVVTTKLNRPTLRSLRDWLFNAPNSAGIASPVGFKTPSEIETQISCRLGPGGLECHEVIVAARCPSAVEVTVPNGGTTTVPVNCTGPDSNGYCDCEFATP